MRCSGPGLEWGKALPFIAVEDRRPTCHVPFSPSSTLHLSTRPHPESPALPRSVVPSQPSLGGPFDNSAACYIHYLYTLTDSQITFDWQGGHVSGWQADWRAKLDFSHDVLARLELSSQSFDDQQLNGLPILPC